MVKSRQTRKAMKGGFSNSADIWSFGICKMIIDAVGEAPAGTKKNWRECLIYLAGRAGVTPEHLYNKMTPIEFLTKIFRDGVLGKNHYGIFRKPWESFRELWQRTSAARDDALAAGKTWGNDWNLKMVDLPGKPVNEAARAAKEAANEERRKQEWFKERSEFEGEPWYAERVKELEDGASIVASEECEDRMGNSADPGLCLAARKGQAKRAAASEARLKERTRKAIANRNAGERWGNAEGELLALAAKHGNTANNFGRVYNGVPTGIKATKKNPHPRAYEPGTGTWLTGRNVPRYWPQGKAELAWAPAPGKYGNQRTEGWQPAPRMNGDFLNPEARSEIMSRVYPEYAVSGPGKKLPERALYDEIATALKGVRYEKGFENAVTHQPQLDVYDQAFSRAMNWRRKGAVSV